MKSNRRTFIKNSAVASAAVALFPSCIRSTNGEVPEVGVQLYTVRESMTEDPVGTLEKVAQIGYRKVETAGYGDGKVYGFTGKEFKNRLNDLGLKHISGHFSLDVFRSGFDQALEFMVEAGQKYVVMPWLSEDQRTSLDQYRSYAAILNTCAEKARPAGIKVCYHNHDFEFQPLEGELPMDVILKELDPDLVDIELDLYWISKVGLDPLDFFRENERRVPLWHVKDMADSPRMEFTEVGNGTIDYQRIFSDKKTSGMEHFFVEQDVSENPMLSIEASFNNLTKKILG